MNNIFYKKYSLGVYLIMAIEYDTSTYTLTLTSPEDFESNYKDYNKAEHVVLSDDITNVPAETFKNWMKLKSVEGKNVNTIGISAFQEDNQLETANFPAVTGIDSHAFEKSGLTAVNFPEVSSIGSFTFCKCEKLKSVTLEKATTIGQSAFSSCSELSEVSIPSVQTLGTSAFRLCTSLENFELNNITSLNGKTFAKSGIKTIKLPEVKTMRENEFKDCIQLSTVNLPKLTEVPDEAFSGCISLENLDLPKVTKLSKQALESSGIKNITLSSMTLVEDENFSECSELESVTLPRARSIGESAFSGLNKLKEVKIPQANYIGNYAFFKCTSLTKISVRLVETIGKYAFYGCTSLELASMIEARNIGSKAFHNCTSLKKVYIGSRTREIDAFEESSKIEFHYVTQPEEDYSAYDEDTSSEEEPIPWDDIILTLHSQDDLEKIKNNPSAYKNVEIIILEKDITVIPEDAFKDWKKLKEIQGINVRTVGKGAFSYCKRLTTVDLPKAETIEYNAFVYCERLTEIVLLEAKTIGEFAFGHCFKLTQINLPKATKIGKYAFRDCTSLTEFSGCRSLEKISESFPDCEIDSTAFYGTNFVIDKQSSKTKQETGPRAAAAAKPEPKEEELGPRFEGKTLILSSQDDLRKVLKNLEKYKTKEIFKNIRKIIFEKNITIIPNGAGGFFK